MKQVHIAHVKPEFRVLGIAACKLGEEYHVLGTVFKGNSELDGILAGKGKRGLEDTIIKTVNGSKHHGQVRLILLDEDRMPSEIAPCLIWEKTGKPVLVLTREDSIDPRYMFHYRDRVVLAKGIDEKSATRVLNKIHGESGSEALRIADIILENISQVRNV